MKLLVIDGNSILNRSFYGIKLLTTKDGQYTNAIYGFLTTLYKVKEETNPDAIAIAFDRKAPTFRHKFYSKYKANRKGMPNELAMQMPILKELLVMLGYKIVECDGFEADDILGTLAEHCKFKHNECVIATGDRDSLQLVDKDVSVRIAATKMGKPQVTLYDENKIMEDYGLTPKQLIDLKAIQGDTSDNIPGVKGIGQKGALDLIQRFNSLDYIYENIDTIDLKDSIRKKLKEGKDSAYMSKELGTIRVDAPIDVDISHYIMDVPNNDDSIRLMTKLEFFSLINKFGLKKTNVKDDELVEEVNVNVIMDEPLSSLKNKINEIRSFCFIANVNKAKIDGLYLSIKDDIYCVKEQEGFIEFIKEIFEDETIKKITHDIKPIFSFAEYNNIYLNNVDFDTMLAAYLLNPSSSNYNVTRLAEEYGIQAPSNLQDNNVVDIFLLPTLLETLDTKIKENNQEKLLKEIEIPLAKVLAKMENEGFEVNANGIREYSYNLEKQINELQHRINSQIGYEININSPKQLGFALFECLGLPHGKKTRSGYSTSAEVLENLKYDYPIVDDILQFRTLSKLKSTYCDGLLKVISDDGRVHSNFNQVETRTGRISSTDPNLQNIPVRSDVGKQLRKFFCAKKGCVLVDADYSQIELRVLAHVAKDKNMIDAFKNNVDIHSITAMQVFNMPESMITPLMRSRAKAVNFGIVYGISAFSLSKDIGVTTKEASNYIKSYLSHYAGVNDYMNNITNQAKENGYVETMFGRRRYLPELTSSNFNLRSFGERVAKNMPIQGTAADIIKIAMIRVGKRLEKEKLKSKLILQVHDELIVEAPIEEANKVKMILQEEMEKAVKLDVPLVAHASIGETWYEAKE